MAYVKSNNNGGLEISHGVMAFIMLLLVAIGALWNASSANAQESLLVKQNTQKVISLEEQVQLLKESNVKINTKLDMAIEKLDELRIELKNYGKE